MFQGIPYIEIRNLWAGIQNLHNIKNSASEDNSSLYVWVALQTEDPKK